MPEENVVGARDGMSEEKVVRARHGVPLLEKQQLLPNRVAIIDVGEVCDSGRKV